MFTPDLYAWELHLFIAMCNVEFALNHGELQRLIQYLGRLDKGVFSSCPTSAED
ncbi:TPA: hypothetical protein I7234_15985 [Vibrio vulnificus]|nr:hypothetical protein [Vibrio vulnificus]EGR7942960.1 hypothetical protein [Vibrio vulnificus]ELV8667254.1 hypothetical protein [Vibrio vulnificus]MCU8409734.1 hypothetical protein [Vibrio vulnificus]MDS1804031.1 hypothetical protein [Vibrio vulnificus]HAS6020313.1 hypothetical protein [Vibrio vulnificus]